MKQESRLLLVAAIAAILQPAANVHAQGLEEIVVTAQRREQSLQDVPISVTAVTGESFSESGFSDVEDMSSFVPNLVIRDGFVGQSITVRGIGTSTLNEAFEQAVATFADGVYYGRDNLSQSAGFDLERIEVVRGPQPTFAGQSATAGAINIITRKPGNTWEGMASAGFGSDEETTVDAAVGGPLSDTFGVRLAGRYYKLDDAGYHSVVGNIPQGIKDNKAARLTAVWQPTDTVDVTFKYEYQDVWQRGTPNEYTDCELRPSLSTANTVVAPGLPALCALDVVVNGMNLALDGSRATGGTLDARAAVEALNAASGAAPGSANYWGYSAAGFPGGIEDIARNLNQVAEYNQLEDREFKADIFSAAVNWEIGRLTLSTNTSLVEYDKEDWLDPDDSSFAVFNDHRLESFDQFGQEIRLTSATDQTVSWMVGAYYQQHELESRIDVYLPRVLIDPALIPVGLTPRATAFGGTLTEDSTWISAFFAATWNVADTFRVNFGGRYQDATKDGVLPAEVAYLPSNSNVYGAFQRFPDNREAKGTVANSDFLPEIGVEFDVSDDVMLYAKYAEAFKNGGFVMSPPVGGGLPFAFTFDPERAEGFEVGYKGRLFDNRLELNAALYYTKYSDLQVSIFNSTVGQFITTNAAESHTQGLEFDGRVAVTDAFTLGFSGVLGAEAQYDIYDGASCNSLESKRWAASPPAGFSPFECRADRSGVSLPNAPEWSVSLNPEYRLNLNQNFGLRLGANMMFSDGFTNWDDEDDRGPPASGTLIGSFERIDARISLVPAAGNWEVALYGRDLTDTRLVLGNTPDFQHKSLDPARYDSGGIARERGRRYGAQLTWRFGN